MCNNTASHSDLWNFLFGKGYNYKTATEKKKGHLDCLKYLRENVDIWDKGVEVFSSYIAEYGHLDCLKYLHEIGCHWDEETFRLASRYGHLKCIKYLHENNCPIDIDCIRCAKNQDVIDFINSLCKN